VFNTEAVKISAKMGDKFVRLPQRIIPTKKHLTGTIGSVKCVAGGRPVNALTILSTAEDQIMKTIMGIFGNFMHDAFLDFSGPVKAYVSVRGKIQSPAWVQHAGLWNFKGSCLIRQQFQQGQLAHIAVQFCKIR
jgi:hypothetical protein